MHSNKKQWQPESAGRGFGGTECRRNSARVRNRSAVQVLGILEPAPDEPDSVRTMSIWKSGNAVPVAAGS